jgi:primosomal protein N' (replication factor Y) (superfamily II helicase)
MAATVQSDLFDQLNATPETVPLYADIVFDRPLDHAYTYSIPEHLRSAIGVGKRVQAPFGRGNTSTTGYCVRLADSRPERAVKPLQRVLDEETLLTPQLLRLTRWMADYYLCGWGQVLNAVIPAGVRQQAGTRNITLVEAMPAGELPETLPALTPKQALALEHLRSAGKAIEPKHLGRLAACGLVPIQALVQKGLARWLSKRFDPLSDNEDEVFQAEAAVTLNADQLNVWAPVELGLRQGGFQVFLLHGVTGSGKTEIYLRAIEEVLRQGKEAIVLVPEISLTPQTIQRFQSRCRQVAVLHSHLGDAERAGHWRRVAAGHVQVVVGARSAVFAPAKRLGLIVIDEEHEGTFKQDSTPRYQGRDVAVMRARLEGIPIILGSATPSLESWHNADRGHYRLVTLPQRVLDLPLPQVGLIDLRHERTSVGGFRAISPTLEAAIRNALANEGQVILLLNRRGFSTHVHCPSCGHVEVCRFCDLALTHHRQRHILLCHYCGYEQTPPDLCPGCGKAEIRYQGFGTEKLQAEVEQRFPGAVVRRMDSDSMRRPGSHERVLSAFRHGLIHILLGTQMIAKGLDFPNVTLVGVVNADVGLHIPDFRSSERTFQLLSQVAGRAGRGSRGGRVLIQTFNPEQPCIALAARHDYAGFVQEELAHRRAHNYPPYERLVRLIIRSRKQEAASEFAEKLATEFTKGMQRLSSSSPPAAVRLLGPAEAPVFRLKGYYRYHFQLQSSSSSGLHDLLRSVLTSLRHPAGVEFIVDVDPLNML